MDPRCGRRGFGARRGDRPSGRIRQGVRRVRPVPPGVAGQPEFELHRDRGGQRARPARDHPTDFRVPVRQSRGRREQPHRQGYGPCAGRPVRCGTGTRVRGLEARGPVRFSQGLCVAGRVRPGPAEPHQGDLQRLLLHRIQGHGRGARHRVHARGSGRRPTAHGPARLAEGIRHESGRPGCACARRIRGHRHVHVPPHRGQESHR